jgi:hypothetical protein
VVTAGKVTLAGMSAGAEHASRSARRSDPGDVTYRERLRTPWWWYPIALVVAALLAGEFHVVGLPLTDWIPFGVLLPLAVAIVWSFGRAELKIAGGELYVRGAHLPLRYVSGSVALDAVTLRRVVGREGDPRAFVSIRPWIGPGVQLWLDDPDDPTPYWLVSTRHPDRVRAALDRSR